jgi:hypothetical protein
MGMISPGNRKLGELPSFSISTESCDLIPGPDEQGCKKICYAKRHIEIYPSAKAAYQRNFAMTMSDAFVTMMDCEIKSNPRIQQLGLMRWHVAGDFYDQSYLDRVFKVCELNPSIFLFGYTKAYHLDWSRRPANLIMRLSDDKGIWQDHYQKFDAVARVYDPNSECPAGFIPCAAQRVKGMTCAKCRLCTGKKGNVGFKKH